jgi:hypothetical protein
MIGKSFEIASGVFCLAQFFRERKSARLKSGQFSGASSAADRHRAGSIGKIYACTSS